MPPSAATTILPAVVLDTNAALDWLVFRNPSMRAWAEAIETGRIQWLGCAWMRDELAHMTTHNRLAHWEHDALAVLATFDALCTLVQAPSAPSPIRLRCTDADDQIFIDLALAHSARWLLSHDKAVLKLARRAALHGVLIHRPADGQP
jgi:predicted nucleic acid-binding protein